MLPEAVFEPLVDQLEGVEIQERGGALAVEELGVVGHGGLIAALLGPSPGHDPDGAARVLLAPPDGDPLLAHEEVVAVLRGLEAEHPGPSDPREW